MATNKTLGRIAYDAYCVAVGGTTFDGRLLPTWAELGDRQRQGWQEAANAASRHRLGQAAAPQEAHR